MINKFLKIPAILILALCTYAPARATPPDMISLSDTIFGVSDTHLFVLRETQDNLGAYTYGMLDIYLVAKNLETHQDEMIWPVSRWIGSNVGEDSTPQILHFPLTNAVNPYDILAEQNALPVTIGFQEPDEDTSLTSESLLVMGHSITADETLDQILRSTNIVLDAFQPYPEGNYQRMTSLFPKDILDTQFLKLSHCAVDGMQLLNPIYRMKHIYLARIFCEDDEDPQPKSLIILLDAVQLD